LRIINQYQGLYQRVPSHTSILGWVKKFGYYQLTKPKPRSPDWVILLDESVQFGQNKLLVIYGVRQSRIDFTRPLRFSDLNALALSTRSSWTGTAIQALLEPLRARLGTIVYAVADQGNPIQKALKLTGIPHVGDLTHAMALMVSHLYRKDPEFVTYTRALAHLRGTQALGKMAHILPPNQRVKARFMNLRPLSDWGGAVLSLLADTTGRFSQEKQTLQWVGAYRELIGELQRLNQMINQIQALLKYQGLSRKTLQAVSPILEQGQTPRLQAFKKAMLMYFSQTLGSAAQKTPILCCSDILESCFGKYKNYLQGNPMVGITNLSLSIAAFTGQINANESQKAFEATRVAQVTEWSHIHIGRTTLSKRLEVLKYGVQNKFKSV